MRYLLVIAVLLPLALFAQTSLPIPIAGSEGGGAAPVKTDLLNSAYLNMLAGNFEAAESQYGSLRELEPANLSAHEGYLWALNAQGKYRESLHESARLIKANKQTPQFHNYKAYALLKTKRFPEARYYYQYALARQAETPIASSVSNEGLAYSYAALGDYINHRKYLNAYAARTGIPTAKPKPKFSTTIATSQASNNKAALGIKQGMDHQTWHMKLAYEDFSINKEHFRYTGSIALGKQFRIADIEVSAMHLEGKDERVYPANQLGITLAKTLYPGQIAVKPAIMASYSHYPRFDIQQFSFMPVLLWRDISLAYQAHYGFMDNEQVNADSSRFCQQVELSKAMPFGTVLGLHYGTGDRRWMIDGNSVISDTFNELEPYYAASLSVPFLQSFSAYFYYQNQDDIGLWYASLKVSY